MSGRFLNLLKQKTLAGSNGPSSAQLQSAGETIYIERPNLSDLEEVILVQSAHAFQTQNGAGLPHPGLSAIESVAVSDSGVTTVKQPANFQILQVAYLAIKNEGGGDSSTQLSLTDGTTSVPLFSGTGTAGQTTTIFGPLSTNLQQPFNIDSSFYIQAATDVAVNILIGYRTLSVA
jgi:hypothetical protein